MRALLGIGIGVLALTACTEPPKQPTPGDTPAKALASDPNETPASEPAPKPQDAPPAEPVAQDEVAPEPEPKPEPKPEPGAVPDLEALPNLDVPAAAPPTLAETAVEPVAVDRPWREVMSPTEPIVLLATTAGVLGRGRADFYDVDENGALVAREAIESPPGEAVLGVWPDNAWTIQRIVKEDSADRSMDREHFFRVLRLRGERRWVPQAYLGEQRVADNGEDFFVGAKGGLLVVSRGITRVAGRAEDPEHYDTAGTLIGAFESARGPVFTANRVDDAVFVSRACAAEDAECDPVRSQLPHGSRWSFTASVARAKYSISALGSAMAEGDTPRDYLLSFGGDAWKLDALKEKPTGIWPAKDGGLWMLAGAQLLHRSGAGVWEAVSLPAGLGSVSAAMRKDASELWVSGTREGKPFIYAVAATPGSPTPSEASGKAG